MSTLKLTPSYLNNYEAAHKILSSNPAYKNWYRESDWQKEVSRNRLDMYIDAISKSGDIDLEKLNSEYNHEYSDDNTRLDALYTELYADRTNTDTERKRLLVDENGVPVLDANKNYQYETYTASDYEYAKSIIKSTNDENYSEFLRQQQKERKESMNGFQEFLGNAALVAFDFASGFASQVDNLTAFFGGLGDAIGSIGTDNIFDAFVDSISSDQHRFFEQIGMLDGIMEFEKRYSTWRTIDGEYTNWGKVFGGISTTLGQMMPSMILSKFGGTTLSTLGANSTAIDLTQKILSTGTFYTAITAGTIRDTYQQLSQTEASPSSALIVANATIKSLLQLGVELALGEVLKRGTAIDQKVFARTAARSTGTTLTKAGGKRLIMDFVQEGLEEVLQDSSDYFVDAATALIDENYGELSELTWEGLFDSFIIGGLTSFVGSITDIITTERQVTGNLKTDKQGNLKYDKKGNIIFKKLNKLGSWEYKLNMQSFMQNLVKINEEAKKVSTEYRYEKNSKKASKMAEIYGEMYAAYRMMASLYNEIGDTRFNNACEILDKIQSKIERDGFGIKLLTAAGDRMIKELELTQKKAVERAISKLKKACMTEIANVVERGDDLGVLNLDENTKKTIQEIFDGDSKVQKVIVTKDGSNVVAIDEQEANAVFVPLNLAKNANGDIIYSTIAEQKLVEGFVQGNYKGLVLDKVLETFRKVTGRSDATIEEAAYNLFFNQSFFSIMLSTANKDMYALLTSLIDIEKNLVPTNLRDKKYKEKFATVIQNMKVVLYNYCLNNHYADAYLTVFTKDEIRKIQAVRWCRNLYARVIDNVSYKKLSDNDWKVLENRVNSMPVSKNEKDKILNMLKSNSSDTRKSAMNRIALVYKGVFTTNYDGKIYMPDTSLPNNVFNVWLQKLGLTIETLADLNVTEDLKKIIADSYGEFNQENLIKYRQMQFMQSCNNQFTFKYNKSGKLGIYEYQTNKQVGFSEYKAEVDAITSGENLDKRSVIERSYRKNRYIREIIHDEIDSATAAYLSIGDVINDPELLSDKIYAQIQMKYGTVSSTTTFLYLRDYFIDKLKTTTVIVLADGSYAFGNVYSMKSLLKNENFEITSDTTISDLIKSKYLYGRLKDVKIKITNKNIIAEYDAKENTIYINDKYAERKDAYLTFALLHEFQHAMQVENGMNLGLNGNWINSPNISKTMRANIIADIRKHRPELFENVQKGSEEEATIANDFVYFSSGESTAYGVDATKCVDFYPTVVSIDNGTKITLPWGTSYNIHNLSRPFSIVIKNFSNQLIEILDTKAFDDKRLYSHGTEIIDYYKTNNSEYYSDLIKEWKGWEQYWKDNLSAVHDYVTQPIGASPISREIKDAARQEIIENKEQSLRAWFAKLTFTPDVTFEDFLDMEIPIIRIQDNKNIYDDSFVSFGNATPTELLNDIQAYIASQEMHPSSTHYLFYGKIKPKDTYGYIGTNLIETLIPTDIAKNFDKIKISGLINSVTTLQDEDVYELPSNVKISVNGVLASTSPAIYNVMALFNMKNVNTKFSADILKDIHLLADFSKNTTKFTFNNNYIGDLLTNDFESDNSHIFTDGYVKESKRTLFELVRENGLDEHNIPILIDERLSSERSSTVAGKTMVAPGRYVPARLVISYSDIASFLTISDNVASSENRPSQVTIAYIDISTIATCTPGLFTTLYIDRDNVNTKYIRSIGSVLIGEDGNMNVVDANGNTQNEKQTDLGNPDLGSMSIKRTNGASNSRYVSQKEAKGTNLEKYGYTAKYKVTQMSTQLKNFVIQANESIDKKLWTKVTSGTLTSSDVMDYFRDTDNIDDITFKLINDTYFKNSKIKTFTELKNKIDNSSKYYAMRAVLKSAGFGEAVLTNANPEVFERLLDVFNKDEKLKKLFEEISGRYYTYKKQDINISEKYLRTLWMKYFDGTVAAGGYIAAVAKVVAIANWKVTGESSTLATRSLSNTVGDDMSLEDVLEDTSAKDAFDYILNNGDRADKIDEIMKAVTPKLIKKLKEMGPSKAASYLQHKREQLENMNDRDFIKAYKKYVEGQSEEDINKLFLKTLIVEAGGIDVSKLNDQQLDQLEISANTISKKVIRSERAIVNNIKSIVRTIKANLSKNEKARFLKDNGDIFDENLNIKKDLYQSTDERGRIKLKESSELLKLEDRVRQLSKSVRANDYSSEQALKFRKRMNKDLEKLRIENERLASKLGTKPTQAVTYEIADEVITIDTKKEIPFALKRILEMAFNKPAKSKTQYLTDKDSVHIQMSFKKFIAENCEYLAALTQSDVDDIVDFYLTSEILPSTNKARQYSAIQIYLMTYIISNANSGRFLLTDEQRSDLTTRLENLISLSAANLAQWRAAMKLLKPEETLVQSLAKSNGIEFAAADVQALVEATQSGDVTRIQQAKKTMYNNALKSYKGRKQTFFDRLLKFEQMAMLSGPGTIIRNQVSNVMVYAGNAAAERVSGPIVALLNKLFPKKFKHANNQYKLIGTKVTSEVETFVENEIVKSGLLDLIRDGLSKYDTRKHKVGVSTDEESLSDLIENAIRAKIMKDTYSNSKLMNKTYSFLFKCLSDDKFIDKAMIKYLKKMLVEDGVDITKGLTTDVLNHVVDAYVVAAQDFMHKGNFFSDIEYKIRERCGDKAYFIYKQFLPFAASSFNWFMEGLNYTPIGIVKGIVQYAKLENTIEKMDAKKQKGEQIPSSRFAEYFAKRNIGKGVIGTIGLGIGMALAAFGQAGIDEEDDTYKLHVGDVYVDISDLFGTQGILLGITIVSCIKNDDDFWPAVGMVLETAFMDSTFTDVFNSFRYSETFGDWLRDQPFTIFNMFVPNFLKTLTSLTYGHTVQYSKGVRGKLEKVAAQAIPGIAYALPKQYDPYTGEYQIQCKAWFLTKFVDKLSPLGISVYNVSEQEKIAISLGIKKGALKGSYEINGEKIQLSASEIGELNKFYGELNEKELKEFISGGKKYKVLDAKTNKYVELTYNKMTDEQKATVINSIMSNNSSKAKIYILTKNGSYKYYASDNEYSELKKLGINVLKETDKNKGFIKK